MRIEIYGLSGDVIGFALITEEAICHEELMTSDYVQLSWSDNKITCLPAGSYIIYNNERYSLLEPYNPLRENEAEYRYTPQFHSRIMKWDKIPVPLYTYESDGTTVKGREMDWEFTGSPADAMYMVMQAIRNETGENWTIQLSDSIPATITISSQSNSIFSLLTSIANECKTEWWADKSTNVLYLSQCKKGTELTLKVGDNVGVPTVTQSKDGYYTRFYVFGSTRNITQDYQGGQATNHIVNKRLTLDPLKYPGGYKDTKGHFDNGVFVSDLQKGEVFIKTLYFDDVYPKSKLTISDVRARLKYRLDTKGNKVRIGGTDEEPVYEQYAIWYFQISGLNFDPSTIIEEKELAVSFESGQLAGRDFKLTYHEKASVVNDSADFTPFNVKAGDFEINIDESTGNIIPGMAYIIPQNGDDVILYNIEMPDEYVASAQEELELELDKEMESYTCDNNSYEFDSYPVSFYDDGTDLNIGQSVAYVNGDKILHTRVIMVEKRLDFSFQQRIRIGNEIIKGNTQQLKEEVANVNQNIDVIKAFNELSISLSNAYANAQREMIEGFAAIKDIWEFDNDESHWTTDDSGNKIKTIKSKFNVWSNGYVSALGASGSSLGGSFDLLQEWDKYVDETAKSTALSAYLGKDLLDRVTSLEKGQKGHKITISGSGNVLVNVAESSDGSTLTFTKGNIDLSGYATKTELTELLKAKADKSIRVNAGTGLAGGGNLSVDITLSLATVGTAGTYTKVTVDKYGRVTGHSSLTAADIPTLEISKINGLQAELDKKLNKTDFGASFATEMAKWFAKDPDGNIYVANEKGFYSNSFISALGLSDNEGGSGVVSYDRLDNWADYAEEKATWVLSAKLGYELNERLKSIEAGGATSVVTSGSGNVVTAVTKSGTVITVTKGITALTSHQAIYALTLQGNGSTIGTYNPKSANATINITPANIGAATSGHKHTISILTDLGEGWDVLLKEAPSKYVTRWPAFSEITDTPSTLAGYGITDGVNGVTVTGNGNAVTAASVNGHTLTLTKGSTFLLSSAYTAADVLAKIKTVDGSGSGLDADMLDGVHLDGLFTGLSWSTQTLSITIGRVSKTAKIPYATSSVAGLVSTGAQTFGGLKTFNSGLVVPAGKSLKIGDGTITWDSDKGCFHFSHGLYSDEFVSALGLSDSTGGGGTSYDRLDAWGDYTSEKASWVLSAKLGYDLNTRVSALEGGSAMNFEKSGTGNALTGFSKSGNTVTFTTGTFLTSHQKLYTLTLQRNGEGIGSYVPTADKVININACTAITMPKGFTVGTLSSVGVIGVTFASGYSLPTTAKQQQWDTAYSFVSSIMGSDADGVIDKWNEIISFLDGIGDSSTLEGLLNDINGNVTAVGNRVTTLEGYFTNGIAKQAAKTTGTLSINGKSFNGSANITVGTIGVAYASAANVYSELATTSFGRNLLKANSGVVVTGLNADTLDGVHLGGIFTDISWSTQKLSLTIGGVTNSVTIPYATTSVPGLVSTGAQTFAGAKTFNAGLIVPSGQSIKIGGGTITWDSAKGCFHISHGLYSDSFISALGASSSTGGGDVSFDRLDNWADYNTDRATWVLSAKLGADLNTRLKSVEAGSATSVVMAGSGNAVTSITKSGTVITATKGSTFLLSSAYTAADILSKLKTVDGSGSGLDADLLDGTHKSGLLTALSSSSATNLSLTVGGTTKTIADLYATQAVNADKLDNLQATSFMRCDGTNSIGLSGGNGNTAGWRLVMEKTCGGWTICNIVFSVTSRHTGQGVMNIGFHTTNEEGTTYIASINLFGSTASNTSSPWRAFYNTSTKKFRLFWYYNDYNNAQINVLSRSGFNAPTNGTWYEALPSDNGTELTIYYNNAATATKLLNARNINGTAFNGTADITTAKWGTARNIYIRDASQAHTGAAVSVDGSATEYLLLPSTITATLVGNASSATKLATARTINGTNFDGTANITTVKWGTARNIYIRDASQAHTGAAVSVDGSATEYLLLPSTITATLVGNADTATELQTPRTINGTYFSGVSNITTSYWGLSRNIYIQDATEAHTGAAVSVNGSANVNLKLPSTITATLVGNASSATKLATARTLWGRSFDGTSNVSGSLSSVGTITGSGTLALVGNDDIYLKRGGVDSNSLVLSGNVFKPFNSANNNIDLGSSSAKWRNLYVAGTANVGSITIGSGKITWDSAKGCFHFSHGLYSDSFVSALGANSSASGGGGSYERLDSWSDYSSDKATWVLSALLGHELNSRVSALEAGGATSVVTSGSGNVVTAVTKSGTVITVTKGITALTSHQAIYALTLQGNGSTIGTYNPKSANATINITPANIGAATSGHKHTISILTDLGEGWDALLKEAPSAYVIRWPAFSELTDRPSTLKGFGITDGVNAVTVTGNGNAVTAASVSGHTLTLTKGSTFLLSSAYTAADVLAKIKTVDGSGSGLDADMLDGVHLNGLFTELSWSTQTLSITIGGVSKTAKIPYATSSVAGLVSTGAQTFGGLKTFNSGLVVPAGKSLKIGNGTITWDSDKGCFHFSHGLYSDDFVSALGISDSTGGGGTSYDRLDAWGDYTSEKASWVLSAKLGYELNERLKSIEAGGATSVVTSGSGNVVTAVTKSGTVITVTKGITALTSHQAIYALTLQGNGSTIGTYNPKSANATINITPANIGAATSGHKHTISILTDLGEGWDVLLKEAPSKYVTRWPAFSEITDTPSTLAGYGITDGVNGVTVTGNGNAVTAASVNGHTLTLTKGSTFLLSSAYTAADILSKLKTVDGSGSGLDADLLDGTHKSGLLTALSSSSATNLSLTVGGTTKTIADLYATQAVNADKLDNLQATSFMRCDGTNSIGLSGGNGNTAGWRLVMEKTCGGWTICNIVFSVTSRHTGQGVMNIGFHTTNEEGTTYIASINLFGSTASNTSSPWRAFYNTSTKKFRLFWYYNDYNNAQINVLSRSGFNAPTNGTWYEALPSDNGTELTIYYNNAATATKLLNARNINGTAFNGTADITTAKWGTARNIYIRDASQAHTGAAVSVDGSATEYLLLPSTITATLVGNASSATKLATARTINGTNFDGTANITTVKWGTARNIYIRDASQAHTGAAVSVDGSATEYLLLPSTITATLSGNASTATKLQTARTLWGRSFDGSANVSGDMTGVGNVTPSANGTRNLGSATSRWANIYTNSIDVYGSTPIIRFHYNNASTATDFIGASSNGLITISNVLRIYQSSGVYVDKGEFHVAGKVVIGSTPSTYVLNVQGEIGVTGTYGGMRIIPGYVSGEAFRIDPITSSGASNSNRITLLQNGNVCIGGPTATSYKLDVSGSIYARANIIAAGAVTALVVSSSSDARLKNIIRDACPTVEDVADAPAVEFAWKKDGSRAVGSIAQYWQGVLPQAVHEERGYLAMQYDVIAMLASITNARRILSIEKKIRELEAEVKRLKTA